ncbi:NAD(P)-binding protein [Microbacterium sp. CFH 90308]|uniref:NAD(P)-binding protein n=1 Tax=Microbacterium salsuginis TaxID=2722803 RepID=A0ABX1KDN8_9MICO|nr:FAD-dependent monooxygenase [Microbacterium sp. CFH 90308]NLP85152.1 NAD(P)-binding protein [Microbacterium sp. CFH 90308]
MAAVTKVAIAGSGVAALAAAIQLAKAGVEVDVFEKKPELTALGSGISLQGNALRALDQLGVWEQVLESGYPGDGLVIRAPGPGAAVVMSLPEVKTGGPDYPAGLGMYRPDLTRILYDEAVRSGAAFRFDAELTGVAQDGDTVIPTVNGEPVGAYDLLIGGDGLHSATRDLIGIDVKPQRTGMGAWRAFVSRPPEVTASEMFYGGPVYIAGYTPTSEDSMYAFLVEAAQDRSALSDEEHARLMYETSLAYEGPWESIRADLLASPRVNYTWFTSHLVPDAWNRGRVVIIGDAAHSCPPTIAQGAAQALEDALVLTELLVARDQVDQELWDKFHARRLPRAAAVVAASVQLGQWQIDGDQHADVGGLISSIAQQMAVPA